MLLFVAYKVFCACLNTSTLDASDGVCKQFTGEIRIRTEALPITTTFGGLVMQVLAARHMIDFYTPTHPSDTTCNRPK
jgi:hypothetical protein